MAGVSLRRVFFLTALVAGTCLLQPGLSATSDPFLGGEGTIFPNPITPVLEPWGMPSGDFNGDGRLDLVTIGTITYLLLGQGDCTFERSATLSEGGGSGTVGDFNEDGNLDIAYATTATSARVHLGSGDGTFFQTVTLQDSFSNNLSWGIAAADFDGDQNDDVLMGYFGSGDPVLFAGNGDGTFDAGVAITAGQTLWDIGVGDFDENGTLDFLGGVNLEQLVLGDGNGGFSSGGTWAVGSQPLGLLVADLNGDDHDDFLTADSNSNTVSVRLGNGNGTFVTAVPYAVGDEPRHLALGDVDSDNVDDLIVGYGLRSYFSFLSGNADGTFDAEVRVATAISGGPIVLHDFDGDGHRDVAVGSTVGDELTIARGHGDGTFDALDNRLLVTDTGIDGAVDSRFTDVNHDGLSDVVSIGDGVVEVANVFLADGSGAFALAGSVTLGPGNDPVDLAIADVDNDTHPDVLVLNQGSNNLTIVPGNGDGTLGTTFTVPTIGAPIAIAAGFFNADANIDVAILGETPQSAAYVLMGNGAGGFSPSGLNLVGTGPVTIETGDFNEDTFTDLVVINQDSMDLSVLLGNGDGTFQPEARYALPGFPPDVLNVADLDDDGHLDLLVPQNTSNVLYGVGDGTFGAPTPLDEFSWTYGVGDVNDDGRPDLAGGLNSLQLQLRRANGTYADAVRFSALARPRDIRLEDADGDGRTDALLTNGFRISVALNIESTPLNFLSDKATLRWPEVDGALEYRVYRGDLSALADGDADGLPDTGYGDCRNVLDPDPTDLFFVDVSVPAPGNGYFYLVAVDDGAGEHLLGSTSAGLPRIPATACP